MLSVNERISTTKQPEGGYIKSDAFNTTDLTDNVILNPVENVKEEIIGLAVEHLIRYLSGATFEETFAISFLGGNKIKKGKLVNQLITNITGTDDLSIISACKLVGFNVVHLRHLLDYEAVELIHPNKETISNIRVMINRGLDFLKQYGPIVNEDFTFEGGYTTLVSKGRGNFMTKNTIWDLKVSQDAPTEEQSLQLLMHYLMGIHSIDPQFKEIDSIGVFNPRFNRIYFLPIEEISKDVLRLVESAVIGYRGSTIII